MGITADVLTRDSQASSGYWEIVRDSLADLVRIQMHRCYDEENHKALYEHVRGLMGRYVAVRLSERMHHHRPMQRGPSRRRISWSRMSSVYSWVRT